jgi:LytS/YehU family sensor histidine kinase
MVTVLAILAVGLVTVPALLVVLGLIGADEDVDHAVPLLGVEVRDDGPGFSDSDVQAGHGLALLRSRLALLFGAHAGLRIDCAPGRTSVVMEIDDSRLPC